MKVCTMRTPRARAKPEGWRLWRGTIGAPRRALFHYFVGLESLCGQVFDRERQAGYIRPDKPDHDVCRTCDRLAQTR